MPRSNFINAKQSNSQSSDQVDSPKTQQRVLKSEKPISSLQGTSSLLNSTIVDKMLMNPVESWSDKLLMTLSRVPRLRELLWMLLMVVRILERH